MFSPALVSLLVFAAAPQGPRTVVVTAPAPSALALPDLPVHLAHAPFVDSTGTPVTATLRGFFTLDLDGNGIPDACWLGDGPGASDLQLAMGREQTVGRFRAWPVPHGLAGAVCDAAPFRQRWLDQDSILIVDPTTQQPTLLSFQLANSGDPHRNGWFVTAPLLAIPPRTGAIELDTANLEGDDCDDVVIVYDLGLQGSSVVKYRLDSPYGVLTLVSTARADVPWPVRKVRLLDYDGDGQADVVAELPGLGVAIVTDDDTPLLKPLAFVPVPAIDDLRTGRIGDRDAVAVAVPAGVLTFWHENAQLQWHWLPALGGTAVGRTALLPRDGAVDVVAFAADGRSLRTQTLLRGLPAPPPVDLPNPSPPAYVGSFAPCGCGTADVDGDGDLDLMLQHPDGLHWYTVRHEHATARPGLQRVTQDLTHVGLGWYGCTYTICVPVHWDLAALPQLELQVMVENPLTGEQHRWDRLVEPIDPVTRSAEFTVWWHDYVSQWAYYLSNPGMLPIQFAGSATAGYRAQLNFMGNGPGNVSYVGAELRTEPLVLFTDPGGGGNKSAQGIVWEQRAAPPLPRADDAMLPWQ